MFVAFQTVGAVVVLVIVKFVTPESKEYKQESILVSSNAVTLKLIVVVA